MSTSDSPICLVRGSINIDIFYPVPHIVRPGQTLSSTSPPTTRLGGKGANVALACALAGSQVVLDACVGGDTEGEEVVKELTRELGGESGGGDGRRRSGRISGERISRWEGGQTGKALIQVGADGENAIILLPGANFAPSTSHTPLIHSSTTHLIIANEIPLSSTLEYLLAASSSFTPGRKMTTHFNPSPMLTPDQIGEIPWYAVDWLVINEGELEEIARGLGVDVGVREGGDVVDSSRQLMKETYEALRVRETKRSASRTDSAQIGSAGGGTNIICTLGPSGVLYTIPSIPSPVNPSTEPQISHLPSAKLHVPLKDTTGAGDCFLGYFVAGLMGLEAEGREVDEVGLKEVIGRCLTACAMCVEREGAQSSYASIGEVEARMANGQ